MTINETGTLSSITGKGHALDCADITKRRELEATMHMGVSCHVRDVPPHFPNRL